MNKRREELIRSLADESGWIRITQEAAAACIGVSKRTYIRWIEEAKRADLIVETSTNGRQFLLSRKSEENQEFTDNVDNVDNVDTMLRRGGEGGGGKIGLTSYYMDDPLVRHLLQIILKNPLNSMGFAPGPR